MPDLSHFDEFDAPVAEIAFALHRLVAEVGPALCKMKRWGYPGFVANSTIATICCHPRHVNLQLINGAHLTDSLGLLEGTGKDMRHIKFKSMPDLARDGVREVILAAIEYDKTLRDEGLRARAES